MNAACPGVCPPQTAPAWRGRRGPVRRARWLLGGATGWRPCGLLCAGLLAAGTLQAATVSAPDEPPGPATAVGTPAQPGAAPGSGVLDKALTGTVLSGNKNLDLLLEMQRNDAAEASQPGRARPGAAPTPGAATAAAKTLTTAPLSQAAATLPQTTLPQVAVPPEKSALSQGTLLGSDAGLRAPLKAAAALARPDWLGGGGRAGGGSLEPGAADDLNRNADELAGGRPNEDADDGTPRFWPRHVRDYVRDNRFWLLGGIAGLLLLGAALRAYSRRI